MRRFAPIFAPILAGSLLLTFAAVSAVAGVTGQFLFIQDAVAGRGGIWGVDATGTNFFGVTAQSGAGAGAPIDVPPYPDPNIYEFSQARTNGRIAFSSTTNPNDSRRIYVMNGDGSGVTQVTFHDPAATSSQGHFRPSISTDGSKIAYVNGETIAPPGSISGNNVNCTGSETQGLWVANSDGTNPHVVRSVDYGLTSYCNSGAAVDAVWSPDGTKLLVKDTLGDPNSNCGAEIISHECGRLESCGDCLQ